MACLVSRLVAFYMGDDFDPGANMWLQELLVDTKRFSVAYEAHTMTILVVVLINEV